MHALRVLSVFGIIGNLFIGLAVSLVVAVPLSPAWGFEVVQTKTEARILPPSQVTPVRLDFSAVLANEGFEGLATVDVVVTWERFGGIQSTPFTIFFPAGCFVPNRGFHVEDFRACGVEMTFDGADGRGPTALSIMDFEARVFELSDGTTRFDIASSFTDQGQEPAILSTLGGAAVSFAIGAERATSKPLGIEAVSGIEPTPF